MSKRKKANGYYTQEFKEYVLDRLELPTNDTLAGLSEELGIFKSAIYHWIRSQKAIESNASTIGKCSSEDKFHIVVGALILTEQRLSACCRRKGLFVEDIRFW